MTDAELKWAHAVLADIYTPEGCRIWWHASNRNTGGVPAQQWARERAAVIRELTRLQSGAS